MKTRSLCVVSVLYLFLTLSGSLNGQSGRMSAEDKNNRRNDKSGTVQLFNGKDLSNWVFKLKDPAVDPAKVFTAQNGVIHITGQPFGYMRTKDTYSDYRLHVEWRWPTEATNSGVFIHAQAPDTIWLKCFECQLQAGNAGDFICMGGLDMKERTNKSDIMIRKMAASNEKPVGEWNTMEVTCRANTIEVFINGKLQNKGTGLTENKGSICLQSEGKDIEFRNVYLTRLPAKTSDRRNK